jgi:hypothetical protein
LWPENRRRRRVELVVSREPAVALSKEERAAASAARKNAVAAAKGWSENEKAAVLRELLAEKKLGGYALELLLEGWASELGGKNPTRLSWVRDYFGTPFEREGQKRFRQASLSSVLAKLVKFCLSAADRDPASDTELGFFELTGDPKTAEALMKLSDAGEGVVLTKHQYANLMKVVRLLQEQGQTFTLPDGKSVKAVVEEVLPEGFAGFAKQQAKAEKAEAERYKAAKAVINNNK